MNLLLCSKKELYTIIILSHLPLCFVLGEAQLAASPGGDDQNRARMIGTPLLLQVAAISLGIGRSVAGGG